MIKKSKYKGMRVYYREDKNKLEVLKKIIDGNYEVLEKYKDTERNFVGKISVSGEIYVLKSPKAETVIPQRKIFTMFKRGESLNSLINLDMYREEGLNYFIVPLGVIVERDIFIKKSYILMEYIEGDILRTIEDIDEVMDIVNDIHKRGIYHGDLNTSNFIKTKDGIKIIDTQGKRERGWNFKRAYDILTLKRDLLVLMHKYNVEEKYEGNRKTIGHGLAYLIKEFKYLPWIEKIRNYKKNLRNKGWKI